MATTTTERLFTPREAAAVSGIAVKAVNNAIDKRAVFVVRTGDAKLRKTLTRKLSEGSLLRLKVWHAIGGVLTRERRERLFADIEAKPTERHVKADNLLIDQVHSLARISSSFRKTTIFTVGRRNTELRWPQWP
jgi:hypothetical protein